MRRLALLKGTKAAVGRKGFDGDLKALQEASLEDFMLALSIANPRESIGWPQLVSVQTNPKKSCDLDVVLPPYAHTALAAWGAWGAYMKFLYFQVSVD